MILHPEVALIAAYALVLLAVVRGFEILARQSTAVVRRWQPDSAGPDEAVLDWPHSEVRRFHRGVSVVVAAVGVFILVVELVRHHNAAEAALLLAALVLVVRSGRRALVALRASPANFEER